MEDKLLLTIPEVARILGASVSQTYRMASEGVLPVTRVSPHRIRVPRREFEDWLRSKTVLPPDLARQQK